jgi:4-amino-4-deoxy-L-arabinose transferase-like glycosyltransferase
MESANQPAAGNKLLWILLAAFAILWFCNLEYRLLIKPDEGRYAEIPREMVQSGDWVTPRLNGLKYFEKPPLQYWATAAAYEVFGAHNWTSRLWDALTGFMGVLLVWFAGSRLFSREAGNYAALILGSSLLYAMMGHVNTLDIGVTFFITLGIVGLLFGQDMKQSAAARRNWMYAAWAAMGLALLSKGLIGFVLPGAALFLYSLFQSDFRVWKRMHWIGGLLIFFAIATPWFYLVQKANPEFNQFFFIHEHWERFTTKVHERYQPWYFFIPVLLFGMLPWTFMMLDTLLRTWKDSAPAAVYNPKRFLMLPWSFLMPGHLWHSLKESLRADKVFNPERYLLIWVVFVFLFFSKSDSKLPSYLLPMFPALALLMGKQLAAMSARRAFWLTLPVLPVLALLLGTSFFAARFAETPVQVEMYGAYANWLIAALLLWMLSLAAALFWLRRGAKLPAIATLAFAALAAVILATAGYNTIARERSAWQVAEAIRSQVKPDMKLYSVLMYEQTLPFYLKRTFTLVEFTDEMKFGTEQEPQRYVPSRYAFVKVWDKEKEALAIMPLDYYPEMQGLGLAMKEIYRDHQYIVVTKP